jgi:hypothetical protein
VTLGPGNLDNSLLVPPLSAIPCVPRSTPRANARAPIYNRTQAIYCQKVASPPSRRPPHTSDPGPREPGQLATSTTASIMIMMTPVRHRASRFPVRFPVRTAKSPEHQFSTGRRPFFFKRWHHPRHTQVCRPAKGPHIRTPLKVPTARTPTMASPSQLQPLCEPCHPTTQSSVPFSSTGMPGILAHLPDKRVA